MKRSAAIFSSHITGGIAPAGTESSHGGPVCYIPEREVVSGYRQGVASIVEPGGDNMRLPPAIREGSFFESLICARFGSIGISNSHDGKCHRTITDYNRFIRLFSG